jgi:hypothetical protein
VVGARVPGPDVAAGNHRPASLPGAGRVPLASRYTGAFPARQKRPRLLAHASQLGPDGVKVTLGALGPDAQLATRLLEHPDVSANVQVTLRRR